MIKLTNINKYFNKNKRNQNHVCNSINLEFKSTGLVVILGNSGSGKTTLLNVLSGMDKFHSGTLLFDGEIFEKYKTKKWDVLRRDKIGYIFQNYQLLKELTVSQNIEIVLKMYGMTNQKEIDARIKSLLEAVGLGDYTDRLAKQLSGGQQQRIAFARALAKDPSVILADEPTGNVDSKTTIDLMNILQNISLTKLVIMVTHEQKIADHYADRIIELHNGKVIKDFKNENRKDLALLQEQIIYLQDYNKTDIENDKLIVSRYNRKQDKTDQMDVQLIERNETIYVKVNSENVKKLKIINQDSEIELKDESSKNAIPLPPIKVGPISLEHKKEGHSAISLKDSFRYAKRKFNTLSNGGKLLYLVLSIVGIIISVSVGMIGETFRVDQNIAGQNRNYISMTTEAMTYEEVLAFTEIEGIEQVLLLNREVTFSIESEKYYEINSSLIVKALPVDINFLDPDLLVYGEMPVGYGVVIDRSIADEMIQTYRIRGIENYEDILDCSFKLQASGSDTDLPHDNALYFPITGIANDYSKTVWMAEDLMYSIVTPNLISNTILGDYFELTSGTMPLTFDEIVLHEESPFLQSDELPGLIGITSGEYQISGTYKYTQENFDYNFQNLIVTSEDYLKHEQFSFNYPLRFNFNFYLYSTDIEANLDQLRDLGYQAENAFLYEDDDNQIIKFDDNVNIYLLSISGIIASIISIYFIMRTSLISRVYEVSVYRSLGASRSNIRKMFFVEILLTTTMSAVIGFTAMTILLIQAEASVAGGVNLVHYSLSSFFLVL